MNCAGFCTYFRTHSYDMSAYSEGPRSPSDLPPEKVEGVESKEAELLDAIRVT